MSEIAHWVVVMRPMGPESLVVGTREEVASLRPREMTSFPLADFLAGGWTKEEIQTPAQLRESMRRVKGPYFEPLPIDTYAIALECSSRGSA